MKITNNEKNSLQQQDETIAHNELFHDNLTDELASSEARSEIAEEIMDDNVVDMSTETREGNKVKKKKGNKNSSTKTKKGKQTEKHSKFKSYMDNVKDMLTYVGDKTLPLRRQIRFKLVVAFIVPALLIIALGVLSISGAQGTIINNYEQSSEGNIENSALYCSLLMKDIETKASQLGALDDFYLYYTKFNENDIVRSNELLTYSKAMMTTMIDSSVGIYAAYAFGELGKAMSTLSTQPASSIYTDFISSDEYTGWKEKSRIVGGTTSAWVGYHALIDSTVKTNPDIYAASYIKNFYRGEGFIVFDLLGSEVMTVLENSISSDNSIVAFVTPDGRETVVTGKDESLSDLKEGETVFYNTNYYNKALKDNDANGKFYVKYKGKTELFVYSKVGNTGALICTLIPKSDIFKELNGIRFVTTLFVVIAFLVAVFIGLYLSNDIGKALNSISVVLKKVSDGDFTTRIDTKRKDEFGILASDMDDTIINIRDLVADMASFGHNVSDAAYKVSGASGEILTSINEASETVNVMSKGVGEQAQDTEKCFEQMTDFAGQISEAYESTVIVGKVANNTQNTIFSGKNIVNELIQQVTATSEVTNIVINDIEELERQSKNIGSIIGTINEIASSTNLLSLNASIEAARAGDAGRGFAVVADQIRGLADQSVESVKSIEKIVKYIQDKTKTTAASANRAEQLLDSQTEALNNTVKVFQEIDRHMLELLDKINHITNNMETITVSKDEVLDAIKDIAAVTQQTLASSEMVDTNMNNQITSIEILNRQAEDMKVSAKELKAAIDKFII